MSDPTTETLSWRNGELLGHPQPTQAVEAPVIQPGTPAASEEPVRTIDRYQARKMRELERSGVPMWMDHTGFEATVKALSFADKTMLQGIDPRVQAEITAGMNGRGGTTSGRNITFGDLLRGVSNEERLVNAVCVAGFVFPRLTLTEQEADQANDPKSVWWVQDLAIEDRRKYSGYVLGNGEEAEAKRIANFLVDRVANPGDSGTL